MSASKNTAALGLLSGTWMPVDWTLSYILHPDQTYTLLDEPDVLELTNQRESYVCSSLTTY